MTTNEDALMVVIEYAFPFVLSGEVKIFLVNKQFRDLWRIFIGKILAAGGLPPVVEILPWSKRCPNDDSSKKISFIKNVLDSCTGGQREHRVISSKQLLMFAQCTAFSLVRLPDSTRVFKDLYKFVKRQFSRAVQVSAECGYSFISIVSLYSNIYEPVVQQITCVLQLLDNNYCRLTEHDKISILAQKVFMEKLRSIDISEEGIDDLCRDFILTEVSSAGPEKINRAIDFATKLELLNCLRLMQEAGLQRLPETFAITNGSFIFCDPTDYSIVAVPYHTEMVHSSAQLRAFYQMRDDYEDGLGRKNIYAPIPDSSIRLIAKARAFADYHDDKLVSPYARLQPPMTWRRITDVVCRFDADFVDVDIDEIYDLINLSDYLIYTELVQLASAKLASITKDKTPEQIRQLLRL